MNEKLIITMTSLLIRNGFGSYEEVISMPFRLMRKYYKNLINDLKEERKNEIETQINILKNFRCPLTFTKRSK